MKYTDKGPARALLVHMLSHTSMRIDALSPETLVIRMEQAEDTIREWLEKYRSTIIDEARCAHETARD